jgi:ADP-L-glycero-D-manno-heptose 6-epimerase
MGPGIGKAGRKKMILITGGAGFIGSYLHGELVARNYETVIVDWLGSGGKWRNIASHPPQALIPPEKLEEFLIQEPPIEVIYHLGAISETTATDGDLAWQTNVTLSQRLWDWCSEHNARLIYASSAATYGNGGRGFDDDLSQLGHLSPLNLYGWTKHVFDQSVVRQLEKGGATPPQWVGLKFFNVYGPNEYHKGRMISVAKVKYDELAAGNPAKLFRSDTPNLADGAQARDFIWVGDIVDVMLWLLDTPKVSGLFNLGTGVARTYLELVYAVCDAMGVERRVEFIEMPAALKGQYQSFTQAKMDRLQAAGYSAPFTSIEDGIRQYVEIYLATGKLYH